MAEARHGGPQGLPPAVAGRMQQAFGTDLSAVRVQPSSASATGLGVQAYTRGNDVHIAEGLFENQMFERNAENSVKAMVLAAGRVVRYEVTMSGKTNQFGLDGVPEQLDFAITPYTYAGGNGEDLANWRLSPGEQVAGTLYNGEGGAGTSDEYIPGW